MQNRVPLVDDGHELRQLLARRLATHDRTLDMQISNLRRKRGGDDSPCIETFCGLGYSYRSLAR